MKRVTIGCDPEFVIKSSHNGSIIVARDICGDMRGRIGTDICGRQMELRPRYSSNIFTVLTNIRSLLRTLLESNPKLKDYGFIGGHFYKTAIGGHIHIRSTDGRSLGNPVIGLLDKILSNGLAYIIDDLQGKEQRNGEGYGQVGDWRHSGAGVEYRTPPCWLVSPTLTFMYLTLAKICGLLALNEKEFDIDVDNIVFSRRCGISLLKFLVTKIRNIPPLMEEEDVVLCIKLIGDIKENAKKVNWNRDFKKAWGL